VSTINKVFCPISSITANTNVPGNKNSWGCLTSSKTIKMIEKNKNTNGILAFFTYDPQGLWGTDL
jgi:hypothetical protein